MFPKDPKEDRFLHTLPGAQKAMARGPMIPGAPQGLKQIAVPPMSPGMRMPVRQPHARPFGMLHDYLNPKASPAMPKALAEDEEPK